MEERSSVTLQEDEQIGEVKIADEVVSIIAGLAANEVEGVSNSGSHVTGKKSKRNFAKGVKIDIADNEVICDIDIYITFGVKIPDVSKEIQEKVKSAIENMTGLQVKEVNLAIMGIHIPK